ncbi:ABC transporter G family member 10 [Acorus calamus]|uniref:ABC transporter G family member 10 n=1 Tax=Acorus calamus TaxID=4465 RepID=A0AAV9F3L0_ACOCL|nr:ABC transporter G family member 10 [Acorus calamus]
MALPVKQPEKPRYKLETKSLTCSAPSARACLARAPPRRILHNVTCEARAGEILAIVGPSGAGKTTLLAALAGAIPRSRLSGRILVNNRPMNSEWFRRVSGYVTQDDDALFPLLTVEESLAYTAQLRLGRARRGCAAARARELLKELELEGIAGSRVGGGISGGERRRVSIGAELVHRPSVLLLDEPTSGLDSASALHVMSLLKSMASVQRKTVVLTIHQPGFRILDLFDRVVLVSRGEVRHHGTVGLLEARLAHACHVVPDHVNVLEFAIDVVQSLPTHDSDSTVGTNDYNYYCEEDDDVVESAFYANSRCEEVLILSGRFFKNVMRTRQLFMARTLQSLVAGFGLGTIFMNVRGHKTELQSRVGFFAFSLTFLLSSTTEGLPVFLQERRILMNETSRGAYRVSSYVIANAIVFFPFLLIVALLYTTPVYWLVGLRRDLDGFLYFSLVVWLVVLMANSFVAFFSALVPNFIMGNSLVAGFMGSFFLFSGYFISKQSIPKYWEFMHYLSLFKYPFEAFLINEYGGPGGARCINRGEGGCVLDGRTFLRQQEIAESQRWSNVGVMVGFVCAYRVLCFLVLWFRCYWMRS